MQMAIILIRLIYHDEFSNRLVTRSLRGGRCHTVPRRRVAALAACSGAFAAVDAPSALPPHGHMYVAQIPRLHIAQKCLA